MTISKRIVKHIALLLIITALFAFSSCGKSENKVYFIPDCSCADFYEIGDVFKFNVTYLYTGEPPQVELTEIMTADGTIVWNSFENSLCNEFDEYNGYKMGYLQIEVPCLETVDVKRITILVNGQTENLNFTKGNKAAKHTPGLYSDKSGIRGGMPIAVYCNGNSMDKINCNFSVKEDIEIESFGFTDFLSIDSSSVFVDGINIGNLNEVFPLSVKQGSSLTIKIEKASFAGNEYADFIVSYVLNYHMTKSPEDTHIFFDKVYLYSVTSQKVFEEFIEEWEKNYK